jgi:glycosyltransferase involved in cell wall biosynthesis
MVNDVTVVIPTIPVRRDMLMRALNSVMSQYRLPDAIIVVTDLRHEGSYVTRNRALQMVKTEWVAFLDDDDEMLPDHLEQLMDCVYEGVDVIYTGCRVINQSGHDLPAREEWGRFGLPFDADLLRDHSWLPVTSLCRTELAQRSAFIPHSGTNYDDWGFYVGMLDQGAKFLHYPVVTWIWHHHGTNTSGRGDRW